MKRDRDGVYRFELGLTESLNSIPDDNPWGFMKSEQWRYLYKNGSVEEKKQFIRWWYKKHKIEDRIREEYKKTIDEELAYANMIIDK